MKRLIVVISAFVLAPCLPGYCQVTVAVSTDRQQYIQYEPVMVTVSLKNNSGHQLNFGVEHDEGGFLAFHIRNMKNQVVQLMDENFNPAANLILSTGVRKTLTFALTDYYAVQQEDNYEITVRVGHRRLSHDYLSNSVQFQVRRGVSIWKRNVGVPNAEPGSKIPTRLCSINIIHIDDVDLYYLQIENQDYVYSVNRLGPRVHGIRPDCDVDGRSFVHTLIQTQPRLFCYRVFSLSGAVDKENYYVFGDTYPRLVHNPDVGSVTVQGGRLAVEGVDYNVKSPASDDNNNASLSREQGETKR